MTAEQLWKEFSAACEIKATYDAWAFGGDADGLARLVLAGVKSATSSAFPLYELEDEPLPEPGEYSVILDRRGEAVCVICTERVNVAPYREVGEDFAYKEGEGDKSLEYWRRVHKAFFTRELAEAGLCFTPEMLVVCEEFRRVWPGKGGMSDVN